jgi:hypothetical protein
MVSFLLKKKAFRKWPNYLFFHLGLNLNKKNGSGFRAAGIGNAPDD